jgi:hypothetical protein
MHSVNVSMQTNLHFYFSLLLLLVWDACTLVNVTMFYNPHKSLLSASEHNRRWAERLEEIIFPYFIACLWIPTFILLKNTSGYSNI